MIIDPRIVDLLDGFGATRWQGRAWRLVFEGREPLTPTHSGGRWAPPGAFGVLYTSLARDGAIAESDHLIAQYSIAPSKARMICEIELDLAKVVDLSSETRLAQLGVDMKNYGRQWGPCPEIGAAANLLQYQGILVPNARLASRNLAILTDQLDSNCAVEVLSQAQYRPTSR